jgi:hypothetical protein
MMSDLIDVRSSFGFAVPSCGVASLSCSLEWLHRDDLGESHRQRQCELLVAPRRANGISIRMAC